MSPKLTATLTKLWESVVEYRDRLVVYTVCVFVLCLCVRVCARAHVCTCVRAFVWLQNIKAI